MHISYPKIMSLDKMAKAIVMQWLSWSWKSTKAEEFKKEWYIVFNRDMARLENPTMKEKEIIKLEDNFILDNVWNDIVIDNTHMNSKSRYLLYEKLKQSWYEITKYDMAIDFTSNEEYLEVSILRNSIRQWTSKVPNSVIYQQYLQEYEIPWKVIICDIDWTVANLEHRLHYIKQEKKDHDSFYANVKNDTPIVQTIEIVRSLKESWYTIVMMSGRRNQTCEDTEAWLDNYNVPYDYLLMRSWWDKRPDHEVKLELYERCLRKNDVFLAIDDRKSIVDLWRSLWIFVLDVRQTDTIF